ncbi:helix-turn-helix transcriptional regulator [Fluviicola sp.]|uniref:AraC family transcriptional regulator n=1 Tax=Fluviicola sp. TaxID=1917219 RepID=UPI0031E0AE36
MSVVSFPHPNKLLVIESLDYPNAYDFHTPHRHDYFEIILVKEGEGKQLIDFTESTLKANDIYVVYPGQIHLLNRNTSQGLLIQFHKNIFDYIFPVKHHQLYFQQSNIRLPEEAFEHIYALTEIISTLCRTKELSALSIHKAYSYLKIILITLIEHSSQAFETDDSNFVSSFLSLISEQIKEKRKVGDYADKMNYSIDKLTVLCRKYLGKTPLKLIHEELLIEIRRMMVVSDLSLKEISFELNFDSTANFSAFIKNATGLTPKELQESLQVNDHS